MFEGFPLDFEVLIPGLLKMDNFVVKTLRLAKLPFRNNTIHSK